MIATNLSMILEQIKGRAKLLAVSKGRSADEIAELYALGQRDFGENYAAELKSKQVLLLERCPDIRWHFIGQIQTNKARIIASTSMVHSVASVHQAQALARYVDPERPLAIMIQVNLDGALTRGGVDPREVLSLAAQLRSESKLHLKGLMTILPHPNDTPADTWFERMRLLAQECALPELSMGMSDDFESALAQGATWVRIGSRLFQK